MSKEDDKKDTVENEDDTSADDDTSDENDNSDSKEDTADTGDISDDDSDGKKESPRLKKRIRDLTSKVKEGERYQDEYFKLLEEREEKSGDNEDVLTDDEKSDLQQLKKLADKAGLIDKEEFEELKKEFESYKNTSSNDKDRAQKDKALEKYKDVIDEDELDEIVAEYAASNDPQERAVAALRYNRIIQIAKASEIAQLDVDSSDKKKIKGSKKIDKSGDKETDYETENEQSDWDPGDNLGSMEVMLKELGFDEE